MSIQIRGATQNDAEACGSICYTAFAAIASAHNFPPDFPAPEPAKALVDMAIAHPEIYSIVAEQDARIVGCNFLWELSSIAGVGPITIDPEAQNAGVGRRLMEAVLDRAAETSREGVRLVQAAYHNRSLSLYVKLGFDVREPLTVLQGPAISKMISGYSLRLALPQDLETCNAICRVVHGHDRHGEVRDAIHQGTARVIERNGSIVGYATDVGFFGHAVAKTTDDMKALIAASPSFSGPGFLLPTRNAELLRWCLQEGLRVLQPMTLMSRGRYNEPQGAYLPSILF